ncbi:hypothetical protein [Paralimibaculum aggregatum]|uniref:hypothetical protein n=1 Tax=Paralimibaculum aggregatum TaxID=3036245 RepID=UPI0025535BA8|nr:hypothetical protein [Limibaculum sp. NKW23]
MAGYSPAPVPLRVDDVPRPPLRDVMGARSSGAASILGRRNTGRRRPTGRHCRRSESRACRGSIIFRRRAGPIRRRTSPGIALRHEPPELRQQRPELALAFGRGGLGPAGDRGGQVRDGLPLPGVDQRRVQAVPHDQLGDLASPRIASGAACASKAAPCRLRLPATRPSFSTSGSDVAHRPEPGEHVRVDRARKGVTVRHGLARSEAVRRQRPGSARLI